MYSKILVPIDRSEIAPSVFNSALAIAKAFQSHLMLLHVLFSESDDSPIYFGIPGRDVYSEGANFEDFLKGYRSKWDQFENECITMLQAYREKAVEQGVKAEFTQTVGRPGRTICEFVQTWEPDLIVIGRRGHSPLKEMFLGSVSNYVFHHSSCSILTIHE